MKELKVIVKADVQGSVEAVRQSLEKLSNDEVRVHVIHGAVGAISESDVMLANASNAIIVGSMSARTRSQEENAKRDGVDMRLYRIIYDCIEEIESAMKGMLAPKYREVFPWQGRVPRGLQDHECRHGSSAVTSLPVRSCAARRCALCVTASSLPMIRLLPCAASRTT